MIQLVQWQGLRLAIRGGSVDFEQVQWMTNSIFWREFVDTDVRAGSTVIDLGSHIGCFAVRAASHAKCRVWCAEPDLESVTLHRINAAMNQLDNLQTICRVAVGERNGVATLHEATENGHNTTGISSVYNRLTGKTSEVESLSLADVLERSATSDCAFLKLNVEGAEFGFIRGAEASDLRKIAVIVAELHFDLAPPGEQAVAAPLEECGFDVKISEDAATCQRAWLVARRK